jgi:hypothetical protein
VNNAQTIAMRRPPRAGGECISSAAPAFRRRRATFGVMVT